MSDLRDIQKQAEEQAKQGKLPEKQERPAGEAGGLPNADLNLLNVHGSKQQTKASDTTQKAEAKKAAEPKPEKKEEPGSLLSWSGAWGTVKGGFKTLASLPADTFNAVVNPDHGKVYRGIATGDSVRLADNVGFTASVKRTGSDVYTGVSYLATHPIEAYNRTSERYNHASSEQKGVMFGSTLTLTGTLFWGTGLGGKTSKLLGFAKVEEGIATGRALGEVSALSREANFARGLNTFNAEARVARDGRLAGMLDDAALTSRVLPAGRLGENTRFLNAFKETKLAEGAKTAEALGGAKVADLTEKAKIVEAATADRWALGVRNTTERLSEKLKFDLLTGQGAESAAGTEAASLAFRERALVLTREHKVIGDSVTVMLENGADSAAGRLAMRELKESLGRYSTTAGFDAKTIKDIDKVLAELEESLTVTRSVRMAETGLVTTGGERLGRNLSGKEQALTENLALIEKELSAGGKVEDAAALQRSRELKESMRSFSQATDAGTRERALAEFETRYNRYTASLNETTLGKSGKLDLALTDRAAVEFRATAKGALEAGTTVEAAQPALLKLSNVEAVVREEQVGLKLQQARELTGGAQTAEARAIITEAERLEASMRNLRAAEKVAADTLSADAAGSRAAVLTREKAAADFEGRLNAYNTLVKDSKFAKTAGADLTISDQVAVEARAVGRFGREASPLLNDANAARKLDVLTGTSKGSLAESNLVAKVDDLSAAGKGQFAAEGKLVAKTEEFAGAGRGALAADSKLAAKAEEVVGTGKGALAADSKLAAKAEEVAGTSRGALTAESRLAAKVEEVAGAGKGTLAADSKLVAKAEEVSGINRSAAAADGNLAAKVEASTNAGRGTAAVDATAAGRVEAAVNAGKASTVADTTALGRGANVADAAALNAQRELVLKSTTKLDEAASLGDAAVRARVLEVQQGLERFSSLSANQTTSARELQEASSALRSSIRGYNDALDASPAARALAGKLHLEDSLANTSRLFQGDRLGNLNPALYGDGAKLYLERSMYGSRFTVDPGSLATKVDFANSMRFNPAAAGGNWSAIAQPKLEELVNRAAHTAFRSGSMVQGIASDGYLSYLRSFLPTSATDWVNVFKGYTILNNSYIIGTGLRDIGREINAATESATASRDGKTTARETAQPIVHTANLGTTSGTTGRAGAVLDSLSSSSRTAFGSAGADQTTKRELNAERKDGSALGQVFASQKGPALSPLVQALSTPKPETQAIARVASPVAEELKKKPSWWATVFGDDSGHRPLLKSEDPKSSEEIKSPAAITPVRRIGGTEGGSQRIITPVFDPRYIRLQSELLGTFGLPRALNGPTSMQAVGDRKARVKGGTLQNDEKLAKQFPFLVSGAVAAESGVRYSNSKFSAKAEDREHKGMGKITGGAVSASGSQSVLGNQDGSAPAMVTQGGPQQQPLSSASSQNDEE